MLLSLDLQTLNLHSQKHRSKFFSARADVSASFIKWKSGQILLHVVFCRYCFQGSIPSCQLLNNYSLDLLQEGPIRNWATIQEGFSYEINRLTRNPVFPIHTVVPIMYLQGGLATDAYPCPLDADPRRQTPLLPRCTPPPTRMQTPFPPDADHLHSRCRPIPLVSDAFWEANPPFPVNRMTHRCKNITFPQLRLRMVKIILAHLKVSY